MVNINSCEFKITNDFILFYRELNSETQPKQQVDGYHLKHLTTKSLTQEHQKTG